MVMTVEVEEGVGAFSGGLAKTVGAAGVGPGDGTVVASGLGVSAGDSGLPVAAWAVSPEGGCVGEASEAASEAPPDALAVSWTGGVVLEAPPQPAPKATNVMPKAQTNASLQVGPVRSLATGTKRAAKRPAL